VLTAISARAEPKLETVASFADQQVTGIGVSKKTGRIFVNFPYWSDNHKISVAELDRDGNPKAFPDEAWNSPDGDPAKRFVCVQSVVVDDDDNLWILDPASPKMEGVLPGGAKLVKVDLKSNKVVQVIPFGDDVAPKKSYLNDVRVDLKSNTAFLTESGLGSLVVVDLKTGKARAVLKKSSSTKAEATDLVVDGIRPIDSQTGTIPVFHADGIALDAQEGVLYFHPLTGKTLYKIKLADLKNEELSEQELSDRVTKVADTPKPDGMLESPDGQLYLSDIEGDAIQRLDPKSGKLIQVVKDKKLQWPDTLSWGPEGTLFVTTSQIHRMPKNNGGVSKQEEPFHVFKLKPGA
jgi:sugar lactone lactonase YvrE